ncbi:MAG: RdgB/HAM1 family non-canonical purine NTP pyrophosphatase [Candidatus Obscuribacterales bacterium]|nr:RdgB/HAM1 family non-canonical purine NTP pyrophosphatase [Candidatus Obscuribacterales bacterium]
MKLVIGSKNPGKLKEFETLAANEKWLELELAPENFSVEETGSTFFENAKLKAIQAAKLSGLPALADDSGLVIEALKGKPGIHSARYCEGSDADRRAKVLKEMEKVPANQRHAAFFCAMVLANPDGSVAYSTIRCWEGQIGFEEKGENGFGYDPIFLLPKRQVSAAQIDLAEKNRISHRAQAWMQVLKFLQDKKNSA